VLERASNVLSVPAEPLMPTYRSITNTCFTRSLLECLQACWSVFSHLAVCCSTVEQGRSLGRLVHSQIIVTCIKLLSALARASQRPQCFKKRRIEPAISAFQ
jgi:hypothetical protein